MRDTRRFRDHDAPTAEDALRMTGIGDPVVHLMKERIAQRADAAPRTIDLTQALVAYPPPLVPADLDLLDPKLHKLGPVPGDPMLRARVAEYRAAAFDAPISAANVIITAGGNQAFAVAMLGLTAPGGEVILPSPYFFNHAMAVQARGASMIDVPVAEPSFQLDASSVRAAWSSRTAALVVTDPSNPTGMNFTAETRPRLQETVRDLDGWFIVDEAYLEFQYEPRTLAPPLPIANTILVGSFSKTLSLSGWRVGYLIASEEAVNKLLEIQDCTMIAAPTAAQKLALRALERRTEHLAVLLPRLHSSKQRLERALRACVLIDEVYGDSAVFLWARIAGNKPASAVVDYLLDDLGIALLGGDSFGVRGHLRVAYGTVSETELEEIEGRLLGARLLG